jgi:DNA end-binding protein Ku
MPRVLWKGAITFGLVQIPVNLYSATDSRSELDLTMLDRRTMSPVGFHRINKKTGKEVPWEDVVKGYEYEKGKYAVLSDEDFRRANVEATQTIDILAFVEADQIPFTHFETPYFLTPGKRGEKGYALLRETLKRTGKVGIAQVVIRAKQHLAVLYPMGDMLVLNVLRYPDEIRSVKDFDIPAQSPKAVGVNPKEVAVAERLVESMSEEWNPAKYHDTYREDILATVEKKIKEGKTEVITPPRKEREGRAGRGKVVDLMALLQRSIETKGKRTGEGGRARSRSRNTSALSKTHHRQRASA